MHSTANDEDVGTTSHTERGPSAMLPGSPNSSALSSAAYGQWVPGSYGSHSASYQSGIQRQRSASFSTRIRQVGGVNSIDNFARSWQRAAGFPEIIPHRPSFIRTDSEDEIAIATGAGFGSRSGSLSQSIRTHRGSAGVNAGEAGENENFDDPGPSRRPFVDSSLLGLSFDRLYGTSYGTISSGGGDGITRHLYQLHQGHQTQTENPIDDEIAPLVIKQVQHEDGTAETIIVGQSTVPQTIFNSVNVLIGVGLLSLPLAMKQAGWLLGLSFLLFSAVTTSYTAKILAKCLDVDHSLLTYADLAYISFGPQARLITSLLFCLELVGACVALVVLFADSLYVLIPSLSILQWKIICGLILAPLSFLPLRLLSVTSILGIISCTLIVILTCIDGFIKPDAPGSLIQPARTSLFPDDWASLPLSFGLIMSPWGGHGVFPNIYRDMRHPQKYGKSLWVTYLFTYSLDCAMAIIGWLMFGEGVRDEITANILMSSEYPQALSICIIIFISIIPITKVPLNSRPLVATVEVLCGLEPRLEAATNRPEGSRATVQQASKVIVRISVVIFIVLMSVVFPSFDRIMALMGSCLCFTICIILPLAFHLKIFGKEISRGERILNWILIVISSVMAVIGTVWAFLPKNVV
ncbi:hypothetical protein ASPZODRAFT_90623 [Penicilliopsis zonata CBS 506.65]|uniref:Amino acid transporter transmembrane domain-containing protein n=1 Tax=Penicilliopsis zonata CBS 506.65 TaxID=1073090 RepID=A0A1L9SNL6_9EURO|nr:hypothetical protein ASPZODRAFT_90623 [Penicilliopsis zonata CBS 506.65]OJJ48780.1 hypothetical protein ASPZODRAFT_90623 [Penicilliopsis zonata CBS 506.65]